MRFKVTVSQLTEELSDHDDKIDNPSGEYFYLADTEDHALDLFHHHIAIGCLEDFEITAEPAAWKQ